MCLYTHICIHTTDERCDGAPFVVAARDHVGIKPLYLATDSARQVLRYYIYRHIYMNISMFIYTFIYVYIRYIMYISRYI